MEIRTIGQFFRYFGNVRERTMRVARCIPPDKINWTYAPAKFTLGDGVMKNFSTAYLVGVKGGAYYITLVSPQTNSP